MATEHSSTHPILIWFYGLILVLLWLLFSGQSLNQHLQQEHARYANTLGSETSLWIMQTGQQFYQVTFIETGIKSFLLKYTTSDRNMGEGFTQALNFFGSVINNLLNLMLQLYLRTALLLVCLPFWGLILITAILDGFLIRRIRYHDFHYTSPLRNLWSRRLCRWIPGLFLYLIIAPLPFPVWLIPFMALVTSLCMGWWAANWQKRV